MTLDNKINKRFADLEGYLKRINEDREQDLREMKMVQEEMKMVKEEMKVLKKETDKKIKEMMISKVAELESAIRTPDKTNNPPQTSDNLLTSE